ncbi:MAG: 50S ribosomal protein L15 [Patescibacteria group bacterium]
MELHTLKPSAGSRKSKKRIGRGLGSGHGSYSTRGIKGQRARSGGKKGLKARGLKMFLLRVPKSRGFKSIHEKPIGLNVEVLEKHFQNGDTVNPQALLSKRIVRSKGSEKKGIPPAVKILGVGTLTKKLAVSGFLVSATAHKKIEAVGGSVTLLEPKPKPKKKKKQ